MRLRSLLSFFLFSGALSAQIVIDYPHCGCQDKIAQVTPVLSGSYQRICDGQTVETGSFVAGNKDGKWESYSLTGEKIREFNYQDGRLDGKVSLYSADGSPKLEGQFQDQQKEGEWTYYNAKGKVLKRGEYHNGKPVGVWEVYNAKGKKKLIAHNYTANTFFLKKGKLAYLKDQQILQNDNAGEWFILNRSSPEETIAPQPLGGYPLLNDMFVSNMEIPLEIWETYLSTKYRATLTFENNTLAKVELEEINSELTGVPVLEFNVLTNQPSQLTRVAHTELTLKLLEHKILEALWLSGPFLTDYETLEVYLPYTINGQ